MFEGLFDIKNDRRLSIYLYRSGMLIWCLYLVAGSPSLIILAEYRDVIGVLSGLILILAFGTHMVYESVHHRTAYQQKKKWLLIGTVFVSVLVYVMAFGAPSLPQLWLKILQLLG
ncbi:hypothetical protein GCM10023091_27300 [Ravibacter arvi]|uniref:Uncharacterized protein n=1 Tax=Ravibacter arvi TaxID=2051041 RepID=A0ABP8M1E7_9BACT